MYVSIGIDAAHADLPWVGTTNQQAMHPLAIYEAPQALQSPFEESQEVAGEFPGTVMEIENAWMFE